MKKEEFVGKNLDDTLSMASQKFNTQKAFIQYNILSQNSGGFLSKLFSKSFKIEAWVNSDKEGLQAITRRAVEDVLKVKEEKNIIVEQIRGSTLKELDAFFSAFCSAFQVKKANQNLNTETKEQVILNVDDPFLEGFFKKSDKVSLAFEHIFKRICLEKKLPDYKGRIVLNANEALKERQEKLVNIAKALAKKVLKTGKKHTLSSMSNQERRIIHMTVESIEGVSTQSIGRGEKRKLIIYSKRRAPQRSHAKGAQKKKTNLPLNTK